MLKLVSDHMTILHFEKLSGEGVPCYTRTIDVFDYGYRRWKDIINFWISLGRNPTVLADLTLNVSGSEIHGSGWVAACGMGVHPGALNCGITGTDELSVTFSVDPECTGDCSAVEKCTASGTVRATLRGSSMEAHVHGSIAVCDEKIPLELNLQSVQKKGEKSTLEVEVPKTGIKYTRTWISESGNVGSSSIDPDFRKERNVSCTGTYRSVAKVDVTALNSNFWAETEEVSVELAGLTVCPTKISHCHCDETEPIGMPSDDTKTEERKKQLHSVSTARLGVEELLPKLEKAMKDSASPQAFSQETPQGTGQASEGTEKFLEVADLLSTEWSNRTAERVFERARLNLRVAAISGLQAAVSGHLWLLDQLRAKLDDGFVAQAGELEVALGFSAEFTASVASELSELSGEHEAAAAIPSERPAAGPAAGRIAGKAAEKRGKPAPGSKGELS